MKRIRPRMRPRVLCHDMTQIIVDVTKDARFRKGHVVTEEDIPVLLHGQDHLYVWEMDSTMLHEDDGATILMHATKNQFMDASDVKEGKIELKSTIEGVLEIDVKRLYAINSIKDVMIATRPNYSVVHPNDKLAGMRVIPLVISKETMAQVSRIADESDPILRIHPFATRLCRIVTETK